VLNLREKKKQTVGLVVIDRLREEWQLAKFDEKKKRKERK